MATANTYVNVKRVFNTQPEVMGFVINVGEVVNARMMTRPLMTVLLSIQASARGVSWKTSPSIDAASTASSPRRVSPTVDRRRGLLLSFGVMMSCQVGGRWGSSTGVNNFVFAGFGIPFGLTFIVLSGAKIIVRGARVDGVRCGCALTARLQPRRGRVVAAEN